VTAAPSYCFLLLPGLGDDAGYYVRTLAATLERFGSVHQLRSVPDLRMAPRTAGTFAALLDLLEPALSATPTAQRVVLVGYSVGGTLAFALADRLARRGRAPHLIIMIDRSAVYPPAAPSLARDVRPSWRGACALSSSTCRRCWRSAAACCASPGRTCGWA
jgi:thioesterase domain-containing protein